MKCTNMLEDFMALSPASRATHQSNSTKAKGRTSKPKNRRAILKNLAALCMCGAPNKLPCVADEPRQRAARVYRKSEALAIDCTFGRLSRSLSS
jgi:hypothetical protein